MADASLLHGWRNTQHAWLLTSVTPDPTPEPYCTRYTYTNWTSLFTREIVADINSFGPNHLSKIGLGLDSEYKPTLTAEELDVRFQLIEQLGIRELDIWVSKVGTISV